MSSVIESEDNSFDVNLKDADKIKKLKYP